MWITISFALLAILSIASLTAALFAVRIARATTEFPLAAMRSFESKLRSIESSQADTADALMQVANKVKMQKVRNAANHIQDPPADESTAALKDRLRMKAGLVAGQPARHQ